MIHDIRAWDPGGVRTADCSAQWWCATCNEWFRSKSNYAKSREIDAHRRGELHGMPLGS